MDNQNYETFGLSDRLYAMTPGEVIGLGIDLCAAVESGYGSTGCHGALCPVNITIQMGMPRIGPPAVPGAQETNPDILEYTAPEKFWNGECFPSGDVYSIGLILYAGLNGGQLPFIEDRFPEGEARAAAMQKRMRGSIPPYPRMAGRALGDVVLQALSFSREGRYRDPGELRKALLALPADAALPAAVPVLPLSEAEAENARSYRVDKTFEKEDTAWPRKAKKPGKQNSGTTGSGTTGADKADVGKRDAGNTSKQQSKNTGKVRKKGEPPAWLVPLLVILLAAGVVALIFRSCANEPDEDAELSCRQYEETIGNTSGDISGNVYDIAEISINPN